MTNTAKFLADIEDVCRLHGLVLGHEDTGGAFTVGPLSEEGLAWLRSAYVIRPAVVEDCGIDPLALALLELVN